MKLVLRLAFVSLLIVVGVYLTNADDVRQKLSKHFIGDGGKLKKDDKYIAPEFTNVTASVVIYSILGIDSQEVLEFYGWVSLDWIDSRLMWDPLEWSNISTLILPTDYVWMPDVGFWNSLKSDKTDLLLAKSLTRLEVQANGTVIVFAHFDTRIPCSVNGLLYPFDQQTCQASLGTIASTKDDYALGFGSLKIHSTQVQNVGEWSLVGYEVLGTSASDILGGNKFEYQKLKLQLRRKSLYHILLVILPFSLLSLTAASLFFLDNISDRFNIAVAVLLSMTLYIVIASQNVPKSMEQIPIMGIFMLNQMALLIIMTFVSALYPHLKKCFLKHYKPSRNGLQLGSSNRPRETASYVFLIVYLSLTLLNAFTFIYIIPYSF